MSCSKIAQELRKKTGIAGNSDRQRGVMGITQTSMNSYENEIIPETGITGSSGIERGGEVVVDKTDSTGKPCRGREHTEK